MLSSRSSSIAHPADAALAHRDLQRRDASPGTPTTATRRTRASDSWPNSVAPSCSVGRAGRDRVHRPSCRRAARSTVSVSTQASMIGSQWSRSHSDGRPIACGRSGKRHRREARARRCGGSRAAASVGVGEVRDAERDDARRGAAGTTPRTASRSTPGCTRAPSSRSAALKNTRPQNPVIMRREVHRRPHAVDVHVAHAGVDVVATGAHLVEAERLELHRLRAGGRRPRSCRPACSAAPSNSQTWWPSRRLDDPRARGPASVRGQPALEHVRRLDDVVVDRDHRVANFTGRGSGRNSSGAVCTVTGCYRGGLGARGAMMTHATAVGAHSQHRNGGFAWRSDLTTWS